MADDQANNDRNAVHPFQLYGFFPKVSFKVTSMRTLKDPRKKPELRRRADLEDFEQDARAIKSTPPKKRKTARSSKDDSSGLDDSGSYLDNHSDILSEKSSLVLEDDMSDVSSLKNTPPKKTDYNRVMNKKPEQNGETHMEVKEITRKKAIGKKKGESAELLKDCENDKKKVIEKPLAKGKQRIVKQTEGSELHEKQDLAVGEEMVETKKKVRGEKKNNTVKDTETKTELPCKKKTARKRKLSGVSTCTTESNKDVEIEQTKTTKKTKEQISKEEEKNELKRQTEELRKTNSEKNHLHKSGDSPNKIINDMNNISKVFEKNSHSDVVNDNTSDEHERAGKIHKSVTGEVENVFALLTSGNGDGHCESENDDIESSDLDTSFESVNSGKKISNNEEEHFPESENKGDTSARNGFIDEEPKKEVKIMCDLCGSVSRSKGGHTRHLRKCQPEKLGLTVGAGAKPRLFSCEQCEYSAPKRVLVINHMRTHGIYQCKRCKFRADSDECLEEHSAHEHKDRSDCKFCKNCNRYVKCSEIPLEKHMEKCQGRVPFKCPECFKEFQYESSLKCHVVSHYPDQPKLFSCTQCDYKSNYKANLKKHIRLIHEQRGERNIKCPDCEKLFYTEDNMKRHQKLHSENRPFKCEKDECDKLFKTVNALKFHLISHQTDRPFPCEIEGCSKSFKSKRALGLHLNETHQNAPKNYSCAEDGCSMAFYKKSHFDRHMDAHKDNRTHFCAFVACTKAFRTAEALKVHCLVHTDEKPVKCEHCSYTCRQKSSVKFHMKKKHPELDLASPKLSVTGNHTLTYSDLQYNKTEAEVDSVAATSEVTCNNKITEDIKPNITDVDFKENLLVESTKDVILVKENGHVTEFCLPPSADSCNTETHNTHGSVEKFVLLSKIDESALSSSAESKLHSAVQEMKESEILQQKVIETPSKKIRADMYEFQSEEDSGDEMKPGMLRREYDKDKLPLLPVDVYVRNNRKLPLLPVDVTIRSDSALPTTEIKKHVFNDIDNSQIIRKKPGPKPKSIQDHREFDNVARQPKKRGRKKKCEIEKWADQESTDTNSPDKSKTGKRGSPKVKRDGEHELDEESQEVPMKKKRGPKPKPKLKDEKAVEKTPKKRGRKKKVVNAEETEVVPENGDATINYSEVESGELFGDSKDSIPDHVETVPDRTVEIVSEKTLPQLNKSDNGNKNDSDEASASAFKVKLDRSEDRKSSESESSDIGSDFDEDLKPPPAPRPPPIYDSEDGDIESGPENEELNASAMSNEPLRDFESARETSREISRDFESSREIDDSVKTSEYINSVETIPSREPIGTPASVNPYKNDSVTNDPENPLSHQGSVPHTPSHNSVPATPVASQDLHNSRGPGERIIKNPVHGQTNDANDTTDESSMPEVDKDYVGRFFEEIQCVQVPSEPQISRDSSIDESSKSQDQVIKAPHSDSGVPSSLCSSQTERSMQMQSPPTDLSHKRMNLMSPERVSEYHPRSESSHNRSSERIPSVPSYDTQYSPLGPYSSPLPPRETILRQMEPLKVPSPSNGSSSYLRFPDGEAMLQRQRMTTPYDRSLQSLHRMAEAQLPQHNSSSPLLRHVTGREDMFPSATGVAGSMSRNPIYGSWAGQDVRPSHWSHPAYLQQQAASTSSSLFGKDSYLSGREFMFDPSRAAAERNMFSSLASSHNQRPDIAHDTFQFDRFDLGNYFASHGYNTAPSLPVDYTRSAHSSSQKSLDERYRQPVAGVTDFRSLPPAASTSDMFGMNCSFNLEKLYPRDSMYHTQHLSDNAGNPFLPGMAAQHSMFSRDYPHRGFYAQNPPYPFMNMADKNYPLSTGKLGAASDGVTSQRDLVSARPNMSVPDGQLQDPYRHHSSMIYNMMNKYF